MILATFATVMRAIDLSEDLHEAGILSEVTRPKWKNKRLPPPNVEVTVADADIEAARAVLARFNDHRATALAAARKPK